MFFIMNYQMRRYMNEVQLSVTLVLLKTIVITILSVQVFFIISNPLH